MSITVPIGDTLGAVLFAVVVVLAWDINPWLAVLAILLLAVALIAIRVGLIQSVATAIG